MTVEVLFKEFGEAFGRLFDHRPVLQGEINFCLREFEEKRANREQFRLQKCLEYGTENYEILIPQIMDQVETNFPKFQTSVSEAIDLSQKILLMENNSNKNEWLEKQRLQRSQLWNEFLMKTNARVDDINKEFANEVQMVEKHYMDLEEKLKITDHKTKQVVMNKSENSQNDKVEVINADESVVDIVANEEAVDVCLFNEAHIAANDTFNAEDNLESF